AEAADQGMGRAGGQAENPGNDIPDDGADESAGDDVDVDEFVVHHVIGNGAGDFGAENKCGDEVEDGGPENGLSGREHAGGDDGGNGVGGIVEAVEKVKDEGDEDEGDDEVDEARGMGGCDGADHWWDPI